MWTLVCPGWDRPHAIPATGMVVTATRVPCFRRLVSPYPRTTPSVTAPARQGRLLAMTNKNKSAATWSDVKAKLGDFDRAGLLGLVQDLYTSSKDNRNFLHARFRLGGDVLEPYKTIIGRWLRPDLHRHQEYSVAKAKRPIADYKKAAGLPEGIAELTVYYCEQAIRFSKEVGLDDGALAVAGAGVPGWTTAPITTLWSGCLNKH